MSVRTPNRYRTAAGANSARACRANSLPDTRLIEHEVELQSNTRNKQPRPDDQSPHKSPNISQPSARAQIKLEYRDRTDFADTHHQTLRQITKNKDASGRYGQCASDRSNCAPSPRRYRNTAGNCDDSDVARVTMH